MGTNKSEIEVDGLSVNDVMKRAGIGMTFVYAEIKAGRLKARKLGRRTIILRDDYLVWLRAAPVMHSEAA